MINLQVQWDLLSGVTLVYNYWESCWRAFREHVKTASERLHKDLNLWPFHFRAVYLIIKPSNCTNPSGVGHCIGLLSLPKLAAADCSHGLTISSGSEHTLGATHTSIFLFFFFTGAGQTVLAWLCCCCSCQNRWNVEYIYNCWPLCQLSCYIYSSK